MNNKQLYKITNFFRILGNPTRLAILLNLMQQNLCVSELSKLLDISQSSVSHQLKILNDNNLIIRQRKGKMIYYTVNENDLSLIKNCLKGFKMKEW